MMFKRYIYNIQKFKGFNHLQLFTNSLFKYIQSEIMNYIKSKIKTLKRSYFCD